MNHENIALELLVRNGFEKATRKLVETSREIVSPSTKIIEARIYHHIKDMWSNKETNANFGVTPERAKQFYTDREIQTYLENTINAELIRDFISLVGFAVSVSLSIGGPMGSIGSLELLNNRSMQEAISRTKHLWKNESKLLGIAKVSDELALKKLELKFGNHPEIIIYSSLIKTLRDIAGKQDIERDVYLTNPIREPVVINEYDWISQPPTRIIEEAVKEFESCYGHLSDRIFSRVYSAEEKGHLAQKISQWYGTDSLRHLHAFCCFEMKREKDGIVSDSFIPKEVGKYIGKALAVEFKHNNFKRASLILELPSYCIDRTNEEIAGVAKAHDLAVETREIVFPDYCSMMYWI